MNQYHSLTYALLAIMLTSIFGGCDQADKNDDPADYSINMDQMKDIDDLDMMFSTLEDMMAEEMLAGEMLAGEMLAGEMLAGEMLAGEMLAGEMNPDTLPSSPPPAREVDEDLDGLEDYWEWSINAPTLFNWETADTNGDGIPDGSEDYDGDGLTAVEEQNLSRWISDHPESSYSEAPPHPLYRDLVIQLDQMEEQELDPMSLLLASDTFQALRLFDPQVDPIEGLNSLSIRIHFLLDESLVPLRINGDFETRFSLLANSADFQGNLIGLRDIISPRKLIHVLTAAERSDDMSRAGEAVNHPMMITASGLIIYVETIANQHPSCGLSIPPPVPFVEIFEAQAGTLTHEIGHALQLGHDTEVNNGINPYNIMSVITGCVSARQRYHGEGNSDPLLGSTEEIFSSRFSLTATTLMRFDRKLSVDVSTLDNEGQGTEH